MAQTTATGLPTIGDVVLAWRKFRGLRSTELVQKAGIKKGYLSALEHNKRATPQEVYLAKLADALDVPLQDIYGRRMPPKKGEAEEEDQAVSPALPDLAHPALALSNLVLEAAFEQIEADIKSRHLSKEQMERLTTGLIEANKLLLNLIKPNPRSEMKGRR
jgi:transcriptional regulator with XRE-family HTH domain